MTRFVRARACSQIEPVEMPTISIARSNSSSEHHPLDSSSAFVMPDSAFTAAEQHLLRELIARGVPFMLVGMSAALVQGARGSTEDIDLWFENPNDPRIAEAVRIAQSKRAANRNKDRIALSSIDDALAILDAEKKK